jgi:hypothetical protein
MDDHTTYIEFSMEYLPTFTNIYQHFPSKSPRIVAKSAMEHGIAPGSAQAACGAEGDGAKTGGAQGSAGKEGTDWGCECH